MNAVRSDRAGEKLMIFRCLIVPLVAVAFHPVQAFAQDTLPAPSGQTERAACMKEFVPLRTEAEERGKLIRAASERHATPDETCELIGNFGQSEIKMIKFIEANSARCEIAPQIANQVRAGHQRTEAMQKKLCVVADLTSPEPSISDVLERPPQRRGKSGLIGDFDNIGAPPPVR